MCAVSLQVLSDEYRLILDHLGALFERSLAGPLDAATQDSLLRLEEELDAHFAREHHLMALTGYPETVRHEETHALIRHVLHKLALTAKRQDHVLFTREIPFLLHLVLDHRTREDRRFDDFVHGLEDGAAAAH